VLQSKDLVSSMVRVRVLSSVVIEGNDPADRRCACAVSLFWRTDQIHACPEEHRKFDSGPAFFRSNSTIALVRGYNGISGSESQEAGPAKSVEIPPFLYRRQRRGSPNELGAGWDCRSRQWIARWFIRAE